MWREKNESTKANRGRSSLPRMADRCAPMRFGPENPSAPQEEMTPASLCPPNGGVQGDGPGEVAVDAPPRSIGRDKAQLNDRAALTRTKQCRGPGNRTIANEIDAFRFKNVRKILDGFGCESAAKTGQPNQPQPKPDQPAHAASLWMLSSAQSRRGVTSPRPTCRARRGQESPSPSCS